MRLPQRCPLVKSKDSSLVFEIVGWEPWSVFFELSPVNAPHALCLAHRDLMKPLTTAAADIYRETSKATGVDQ